MMYITRSLSFGNVLRSPLLMVASLCSVVSSLVFLLCLIAPFWFKVSTVVTFPHIAPWKDGTEYLGMTGYVDYNGRWHNLNAIDKATNDHPVPLLFRAAQVFYISAFIVGMVASAATIFLALKPYRHFVPEIATTVAISFSVSANVMAIICAMSCIGRTDHIWPERPYTIGNPEWAAYLAIIATVLLAIALGAMLIETCHTCRTVERVREKPRQLLEDEPLYYKFDYRKIPKVIVEPNPILRHVYTNPVMRSATPQAYHPSTPSAYSAYSYNTQPSVQPTQSYGPAEVTYGDDDMDRSSYSVSVDDQGRRMVSM